MIAGYSKIKNSANTVRVTDSAGSTVILPHTAKRIICQNEDAAKMLIDLGAGDLVVGYDDKIATPVYQQHLPNAVSIGNWQSMDIEKIISLEPDVVIMFSGYRPRNFNQIVASNITILYRDCYKIDELAEDARALGHLTGKDAEAEEYARFVEETVQSVKTRIGRRSSDSYTYRVYAESFSDYSALGKDSSGDRLLKALNAHNLGHDLPLKTASTTLVNAEWIVQQNPDIILKLVQRPSTKNTGNLTLAITRENILARPGFDTIRAVETGRVFVVNSDMTNGPPGPVGLLYVAKAFYPEEFSDIDPDEVYRSYIQKYPLIAESSPGPVLVPDFEEL
jgi:iron complex transport system substrate-binding protein